MLWPVGVLAVLSAIGGLPADRRSSGTRSPTGSIRSPRPTVEPSDTQEWVASALAVVARRRRDLRRTMAYTRARRSRCRSRVTLFEKKFYWDELYDAVFYRPADLLARGLGRVRRAAADRAARSREVPAASGPRPAGSPASRTASSGRTCSRSRAGSPSSPSSSSEPMTDWLSTILIFLPMAGALVVWLLPLSRTAVASLATLVSLVEVGVWIARSSASTSRRRAPARRRAHAGSATSRQLHVGLFGFSLWLVGLAVVCGAAPACTRWWAGRERAARVLRPAALPHGLGRGRLRRAGPAALLRLLRGDADPALRPDRRLGRRRPAARDDHLRRLHRRRLAADARRDHRLRPAAGDVRPDEAGTSTNDWLFLGFAIAFAVKAPLLPFHGWLPDAYRESPPEIAGLLSGVISKVAAFGFLRIAIVKFPEPTHDCAIADPRARVDRARLRLAARLPRARHPRRRRLLVAGADGADHVRPVREQQPRPRRLRAADGQPRAALDDDVPARGDGRAAHRDRRALAARRHGARAARARDAC